MHAVDVEVISFVQAPLDCLYLKDCGIERGKHSCMVLWTVSLLLLLTYDLPDFSLDLQPRVFFFFFFK